jgi:hypothetical protein
MSVEKLDTVADIFGAGELGEVPFEGTQVHLEGVALPGTSPVDGSFLGGEVLRHPDLPHLHLVRVELQVSPPSDPLSDGQIEQWIRCHRFLGAPQHPLDLSVAQAFTHGGGHERIVLMDKLCPTEDGAVQGVEMTEEEVQGLTVLMQDLWEGLDQDVSSSGTRMAPRKS